jgi:YHS domain-containing protein
MILRITYCTVALLLCIAIGLLIETPEHLIAETEPDQVQKDENPEDFLLPSTASKTFKEREQDRSRMTSQQILNNALQRELNSNEGFKQAPKIQIRPATVSHPSRKKTLTIIPLQKKPRRKSGLKSRNSASLEITSTATSKVSDPNLQFDQPGFPDEKQKQLESEPALPKQEVITATQSNTPEREVVLSSAKSASSATVPAGFLKSPKPNSAHQDKKSSLSIFKRAIKGLNRRSEPQTGANERSQSSAPRRFIPTNPKPVLQNETSIRQAGESASQGKIVQAQQNSSITRELEKLYRKDGRQMPRMRTPNQSRVLQGNATNQGFATSGIAPGNNSRNPQSANSQKKLPIWKRLFSIGRKKKQPQNQQSQHNPQPQQLQQPQYNQQPSSQQLPRIPSSAPNYGTRNKPGVPGLQRPAASPFGRQNPTNISRTPRPFPGNAPGTVNRNSEQQQSLFPKKRRINGNVPQFDSFSDQFNPFAIPKEITEPETPPVNSVDAQSQKKTDPFSDDFNPFENPEESNGAQSQSAQPQQQSTADPFNDNFNPFGGSENNKDSERAPLDTEMESAVTTQAKKNSVAEPTGKGTDTFHAPEKLQQQNLAPIPPVSEANEQKRGGNSSGDSLENAFPDLSETEADRNNPDENPFTGLKLDDPPVDFNDTSAIPDPQKTVPDAGNDVLPRSNDSQNTDENTSEKTSQATENTQTHPIKITPANAPKPLETETEKNSESSPSSVVSKKNELAQTQRKKIDRKQKRENLMKIFERVGLKGFKGFCPVALRDQRELINSKSKFKAIFESRIYYFSTSEARDKFENDPKHYAPVHGGKDLVMLRDDEKKVQGSLDHAVWFRDRLYLFSSSDSIKTFIKTKKKYTKNSSENKSAGDEEESKDSDDAISDDAISDDAISDDAISDISKSENSDSVNVLFPEDAEN